MNHSDEATNGFSQAHEEDDDEVYLDEDEFPAASVTLLDEDPVKAKFERHVEEARILSNNLQSSESSDKASQQLKFVNDRFSEWHNTTEEGKNFLHFLADYDHRIHKPGHRITTSAFLLPARCWLITRCSVGQYA